MSKYINDEGLEVPKNTIIYYMSETYEDYNKPEYKIFDVIEPLIGKINRDWFEFPYTFCLPLTIANQYGFVVKAAKDLELYWSGGNSEVHLYEKQGPGGVQDYFTNFKCGVLTIENKFMLRTPPNINLMVMQPPNYFISGLSALSGIVEADNLRRTFTFNLKVTIPNKKIYIKKGDWLAAFIPVPRFFVENFELKNAEDIYKKETLDLEINDMKKLVWERYNSKEQSTLWNDGQELSGDIGKPNDSGRRYFKGLHVDGSKYKNHQKRIK